uniref:Filamentous hemagglutinin family N-terminal domain-containing protein n=1 Tax=Candidatus Kentrum sp. TC TaxID=2126339 RepID=A0A450YAA3_9GAMM|nr:MAG: filamentous hemagglutinin family N-terminal domain-containing protein [Candidatus Kentron sp. TC]
MFRRVGGGERISVFRGGWFNALLLHGLLLIAYTHVVTADIVTADIATDGTLGHPGKNFNGQKNYLIPETLGKRAGNNLFHSFHAFNIYKGKSATFTGASDIQNVISRVTGGTPSTINGVLRSEIGNADFYFINPWGVLFGADAQIDVPAGFHVGTSAALRFPDGAEYSARNPGSSSLSIESPEAFGFRAAKAGSITIDRSSLVFEPNSAVTLAGSDVSIRGASLKSAAGELRLTAVGDSDIGVPVEGDIPDSAQGKLSITDSTIRVDGNGGGRLGLAAGNIEMSGGKLENANLGDEDVRQGTQVRTRTLTMTRSSGFVNNASGAGNAPSLRVEVRGDGNVESTNDDSCVLCIGDESQLYSQASGSGKAADITVLATGGMRVTKSLIYSGTQGKGDGGEIMVKAEELLLDGGGDSNKGIRTRTENFETDVEASGNAGATIIMVDRSLRITDRASISSYSTDYVVKSTPSGGTPRRTRMSVETVGDAGPITVRAGSLRIDGVVKEYRTSGIWSSAGIYRAPRSILPRYGSNTGEVRVTVDGRLELVDRAIISTRTAGLGDAGDVFVQAGSLRMRLTQRPVVQGNKLAEIRSIGGNLRGTSTPIHDSGSAGNVSVTVDGKLEMSNAVAIRRQTLGTVALPDGYGEGITVRAGSLFMSGKNRIMGGAGQIDRLYPQIKTTADSRARQKPGNVALVVDGLAQLNLAEIFSETESSYVSPGNISIESGDLKIRDARIYSGTPNEKPVDTGNIAITVDRRMDIVRGEIFSSGGNRPGSIAIEAGALFMESGAISNKSKGEENAKDIRVTIDDTIRLSNRSGISTNTKGWGNAGDVTVTTGGMLRLLDGSRIFSTSSAHTSTRGNAGAVTVSSGALSLDHASIYSSGAKPSINIKLPDQDNQSGMSFFRSGGANRVSVMVSGTAELSNGASIFSSTAWAGNAGPVNVEARELRMDRGRIYGDTAVGKNAIQYKIRSGDHEEFRGRPILEQLLVWEGASTEVDGEKVTISADGLRFFIDAPGGVVTENGMGTLDYVGNNPQVAPGDTPVEITIRAAELLKLSNGAQIDTSTEGIVGAGEIRIRAHDVRLDNAIIASEASPASDGQIGDIRIVSNALELTHGSRISIQNDASISAEKRGKLKPKEITIHAADRVRLSDDSRISTRANGNTDAGRIVFGIGRKLRLENSAITTEAEQADGNRGNGGDITIRLADSLTHLVNSRITTSSSAGRGGDILIDSDILFLDTGFIQANTAEGAQGGDIVIDAEYIIIPGDQILLVGGDTRRIFRANSGINVIQAAAPHGISGIISVPIVETNPSGKPSALTTDFQTVIRISDNPCRIARGVAPSTLVRTGRGAPPADIASIWNGFDVMPGSLFRDRDISSYEDGKVAELAENGSYVKDIACVW